ncbi:MAG: hypothetical protein KAQ98_12590 [Bacteriovoracaceae bacterium]|nr:hypothetical protein [Bacteriovoracaceae bacterium]
MKFIISMLIIMVFVCGCASHKQKLPDEQKYKEIQRDYIVSDHSRTSGDLRPGWIDNPQLWAKEHKGDFDTTKYTYFAYETDPKASRKLSCQLARSYARVDIASEIATFIDKSLAESDEGSVAIDENNPQTRGLRNFVENTLAEKIQALIHGSRPLKIHWEKRKYKKKFGAKRDFTAYTCAAFIRMDNGRLKDAIDEAANFVSEEADDPATKANVKKALENVEEKFVKAKNGEI